MTCAVSICWLSGPRSRCSLTFSVDFLFGDRLWPNSIDHMIKRMASLASGLLALFICAGFAARTQVPPQAMFCSIQYGKSQAEIDQRVWSMHRAEVAGFALSAMSHSMRAGGEEPNGKVEIPGTTVLSCRSARHMAAPAGWWPTANTTLIRGRFGQACTGYLVDIHNHLFQSPVLLRSRTIMTWRRIRGTATDFCR